MSMSRTSYAHMNTAVNAKHVRSLLRFFESGAKPVRNDGFGVEIEHLPVENGSDAAADYYAPNGVETLLKRLRPYYDPAKEYWENGHLVGLGRDRISLSLEPGAQVECSIGVLRTPQELMPVYADFRREADPIMRDLGFRLVAYGYQPTSSFADISVNPKSRYAAMTDYLGRIGEFGLCMMRASAATQISIDYASEKDSIDKLRIGSAVGPILAWFFRNSPYFEGRTNPYPLLRQRMWDYMDIQRTNLIPGLYDDRFGWEDYAVDVLSTPLMFVDLTHTPEAADEPEERKHRAAFRSNAGEVYPDRELNDYEICHVLSTHFNDVRLKNFIEIRHWDSLPIGRVERLVRIVGALFYDDALFGRLLSCFDGVSESEVLEAKANLQAFGGASTPYGRPLEFWRDLLRVEDAGADEPGDEAHPGVFQA
ncbi:MAG: glutamate-cysteine ligase family protein [Bifidobacterium sp.]|nr:glutamate-cysteine ligase family protein [Bifidobacterium sp.]